MFPTGIYGRSKYRGYATFGLIVINALVFIGEFVVSLQGEEALLSLFKTFAWDVCAIGNASIPHLAISAFTSMFMHGSLIHIGFNMFFLWLFGPKVEEYFGRGRYILFYLVAGLGATVAHTLLGGVVCSVAQPYGLSLGASGAIAGVMGAFLFLYPGAKIHAYWARLPIFPFRVPAFLYLFYWFMTDLFFALGVWGSQGVAHWAHVGGFVSGFVIVFVATMFFKPAPKADPLAHLDDD